MWRKLIGNRSTDKMERAMDAANLRQRLLTQNIANANTPHYKRLDLDFKSVFAEEIDKNRLEVKRTHPKHYGNAIPPAGSLKVARETKTNQRFDENNIDIEFEAAQLAENMLYFQSLATSWKQEMSRLKQAIQGR